MDLEEIHTLLRGLTRTDGAKYENVLKWFKESGIIDGAKQRYGINYIDKNTTSKTGRFITQNMFESAYTRVNPDKQDISLSEFAQMMGILIRNSHFTLSQLTKKMRAVKEIILDEIQEYYRNNDVEYV